MDEVKTENTGMTENTETAEAVETAETVETTATVESASAPVASATESAAAPEKTETPAQAEPAKKAEEKPAEKPAGEPVAEEKPEKKAKKSAKAEKPAKAEKTEKKKKEKDDKPITQIGLQNRRDFGFVVIIMATVIMFVNIILLVFGYTSGISDQVLLMANAYADDAGEAFSTRVNYVREHTRAIAIACTQYETRIEINDYFRSVLNDVNNKGLTSSEIRYFLHDEQNDTDYEYNQRGDTLIFENENVNVIAMRKGGVLATYGIINDEVGPLVACYCPVSGSDVTDGIIVYYQQNALLKYANGIDAGKSAKADILATCWQGQGTGSIMLSIISDSRSNAKVNDSFVEYVNKIGNNAVEVDKITAMISSGRSDAKIITISGNTYIVAIRRPKTDPDSDKVTDKGLYVAALYDAQKIYGEGYAIVAEIIIAVGSLLALVVGFIIYYAVSRKRLMKRIDDMSMVDQVLQCPTLLSFERSAKEILSGHQKTRFAVVVAHVQHFSYVNEKYGDTAVTNILRHIRDNLANAITEGEIFCYIAEGDFALLTHYRDEARLQNRITGIFVAARKKGTNEKIPADYDLKMQFGVYLIEQGSSGYGIEKMVDNALSVCDISAKTDINQICNFYSDNVRSKYMKRAEIESRMEAALQNGEFRIFYQPKYNLEKDRIDGSELLVRWYDPVTQNYRSPAEFLPVFEENGFISKLDRQIYYAACETIAKWIDEGKKIYPISVNVSRVTAIQPDFTDYYKKVKRHFNIADRFITLEFTESFAYENYEYLSAVAHEMRSAGFLVSIDDFGTGYSTYNVLKSLEIDEIKLDRFFLSRGMSEQTDKIIQQSVINVGKDLKMKVTQEGVETLDQLNMLKDMGCMVIQGYYFARPMSGSDYSKFIEDFLRKKKIYD